MSVNAKNKSTLLLIYFSIIFIFFLVMYILFLQKLGESEVRLSKQEEKEKLKFEQEKSNILSAYDLSDSLKREIEYHLSNTPYFIRDNQEKVKYFIYYDFIDFKSYDFKFLPCFSEYVRNAKLSEQENRMFENSKALLKKNTKENVEYWISKIGKEKFLSTSKQSKCSNYDMDISQTTFHPEMMADLSDFFVEKDTLEQLPRYFEMIDSILYYDLLSKIREQIPTSEYKELLQDLENSDAYKKSAVSLSFKGRNLAFSYELNLNKYNPIEFQKTVGESLNDYYSNYSLRTGDMPYAYCYGSANYGQSGIKVKNGNEDVIVSVKNRYDDVIRHVYINSGDSYTLNIPPGSYKVYFYYGSGWNPKKFLTESDDCGMMIGGFINLETVSKDPNTMYLSAGETMEYTLYSVANGNLRTRGSSKNEAFR